MVIEPIRSADARTTRSTAAWMRWFADALCRSTRSPLRTGCWHLTALRQETGFAQQTPRDHFCAGTDPPSSARGLLSCLAQPRLHYEDWGACGSEGVVPLKSACPSDSGRVKSWRKHARDGTLPPVLIWWIEGLQLYVLLDGHDRLAAANAEGVAPTVLALWQPYEETWTGDGSWIPQALLALYEETFAKAESAPVSESRGPLWVPSESSRGPRALDISPAARVRLNQLISGYYEGSWRRAITQATARPLEQEWVAEVQAALPEGEEDREILWERPPQLDELSDG